MFQIPQHLQWAPFAVQRALQTRGLDSFTEGSNVIVRFRRSGIFGRFLDLVGRYIPRFRVAMTIEHRSQPAMNSLDIHCHPKAPFAETIGQVEAVLQRSGYLPSPPRK